MKVLIIGGVAAGTKTAAKLKREDRSAEVTVITKDKDISYAGCGLPYYVGGLIGSRDELIVNTPQKYAGLTGAEVVTGCEVTSVDFASKTVTAVKDGAALTEKKLEEQPEVDVIGVDGAGRPVEDCAQIIEKIPDVPRDVLIGCVALRVHRINIGAHSSSNRMLCPPLNFTKFLFSEIHPAKKIKLSLPPLYQIT